MTVIAIGWSRGNKKAIATVLPTNYWEKLRNMSRFDRYDIQAAHRILKREVSRTERIKKRKRLKILTPEIQKIWESTLTIDT